MNEQSTAVKENTIKVYSMALNIFAVIRRQTLRSEPTKDQFHVLYEVVHPAGRDSEACGNNPAKTPGRSFPEVNSWASVKFSMAQSTH